MQLLSLATVALCAVAMQALSQAVDETKFNIQIVFTTPVSAAAKASFDAAVARWQEVITGDIGKAVTIQKGQAVCGQGAAAQAITVDDILIFAAIQPIDGVGKVLGSAGPCGFSGGKVRLGSMQFDSADVDNLVAQDKFTSTVLHEMGHIIGVGGDWARRGLVSPTAQGTPFLYLGKQGAVGQTEVGGTGKPVVEDIGGAGTARVHWKESVYKNELMTGFISGQTQPMSALTIRSLQDLGYQVDITKADAFSIAAGATNAPVSATKKPTVAGVTRSPTKAPTTKSPTNGNDPNAVFNIDLVFTTAVTPSQRAAFEGAVAKWTKVITGDIGNTASVPKGTNICGQTLQNDLVVDDIVIFAGISPIDGVGKILGQAGPCGFDNGGKVRLGSMQFDVADTDSLEAKGTLTATILHEMGHVLGIGTQWEGKNLISPGNAPFLYLGANGIQGQKDIGGQGNPIIEDQGGAGTARGHWKESVYQNELMTGFLSGNTQPMSRLTVQALKDLGYVVDLTQADAFTIPSAAGRRLRDLKDKHDLEEMNKDLEIGERELQTVGGDWETSYPADKIVWNIPTQDKELTEDGEEKTEWEVGFSGDIHDFDAQESNAGAIAGGVIGGLFIVGAAAMVVIRRRKSTSQAAPTAQLTAQNPMFADASKGQQQQYPGQYQGQYPGQYA